MQQLEDHSLNCASSHVQHQCPCASQVDVSAGSKITVRVMQFLTEGHFLSRMATEKLLVCCRTLSVLTCVCFVLLTVPDSLTLSQRKSFLFMYMCACVSLSLPACPQFDSSSSLSPAHHPQLKIAAMNVDLQLFGYLVLEAAWTDSGACACQSLVCVPCQAHTAERAGAFLA